MGRGGGGIVERPLCASVARHVGRFSDVMVMGRWRGKERVSDCFCILGALGPPPLSSRNPYCTTRPVDQ